MTNFGAIPSGTNFEGCRVKRTSNQTCTTATLTKISFNSVRYGQTSWFNFGANPTRITVPTTGYYLVGGYMEFDLQASPVKSRFGDIYVNNTSRICELASGWAVVGTENPQANGNAIVQLAANDYIEMRAYQNSGINLDVVLEADFGPDMWAFLLGV